MKAARVAPNVAETNAKEAPEDDSALEGADDDSVLPESIDSATEAERSVLSTKVLAEHVGNSTISKQLRDV